MEYTGERFLPENVHNEMSIEHYQRYLFARQLVKNAIVLDAACGEGYGSNMLSECASRVIGIDIDKEAIKAAQKKYGSEKLDFISCSVEKLPFETGFFDVIVSFETIEHVNGQIQKAFLNEIKRVLKPNGRLVMSSPNKRVYTDIVKGENHFHIKELYAQEFVDYLETSFKNVELYCQYPDVGYFLNREHQGNTVYTSGRCREDSRYLVAVCSDEKVECEADTESLACFNDTMYYSLNLRVHELDRTVLELKHDSESFQSKQQKDIRCLQENIRQMKREAEERTDYVEHLERDIALQKEYISVKDSECVEYKTNIEELKSDRAKVKGYAAHLEKDIKKATAEYQDYRQQTEDYIKHLEKDIKKVTAEYQDYKKQTENYIKHLEKDICILKDAINNNSENG